MPLPSLPTGRAFRRLLPGAAVMPAVMLAVMLAVLLGAAGANAAARPTRPPIDFTIGGVSRHQNDHTIAPGFVGLSIEYWAIPDYTGADPSAINPVFVQLIRNLTDGAAPVLRFGGVTTDNSWWPAPGLPKPTGITFTLTPHWMAVARALATTLGARLILGINLEANSTAVAGAEGKALVNGIGRQWIEALEPGNEPELYGSFTWGFSGALGRPPGWDFTDYEQDYTRIARALPDVPLAGPADGAPSWFAHLGAFLSAHPRVAVATVHRYPLQQCFTTPVEPNYPTIPHLLAPTSWRPQADSVVAAVKTAHAHHVPLRIDEMNTISCGNAPAVAKSFASALWALNALFAMAAVGVDGVNIHTYPKIGTNLFSFHRVRGRWRGTVAPEYYGLDLFAQAAPPGSRLESVSPSRPAAPGLEAWATSGPDPAIRILVVNEGTHAHTVAVRAPQAAGKGTLERLKGPSVSARSGVTLGGQSFSPATTTGLLAGPRVTFTVAPTHGKYAFTVPAGSAAMLTLASKPV